ncbi:MAG TPA: DUF4168 domain-containing protein [Leptolyngbyaceae cyanobacterium]
MAISQSPRRPFPGRTYLILLAGVMALLTNVLGVVIQQRGPFLTLETAQALAQGTDVSQEEVQNYAASVLQMDGPRNEALNQIKSLLSRVNYDVSRVDMTCPNTRNLNQLPRQVRNDVREIVVNYCNQARTIVEGNDLTVRRFNTITEAHQSDPALSERIRTALIQLQQQKQP